MPSGGRLDRAGGSSPGAGATFVFPAAARRAAPPAIVVAAAGAAAGAALVPADRAGYVLSHAVASAPFLVGAMVCARRAARDCPPQLRGFWRLWSAACLPGVLACAAALGAVVLRAPALLVVDAALLVAAAPLWTAASVRMLRAQAGRRGAAVDLVDAAMALVVLSAPGVLLVVEPLLRASDVVFALPLALFVTILPAGVYTALVNLARVPAAERVAQGMGVALAAAFGVGTALQLARALGLGLPLTVLLGTHVLTMALVMAVPLWAHRVVSGGLARLPIEHQVRRANPMPMISAVVLPLLVPYVLVWHNGRWAAGYLTAVLLAVVVLNAARHALLGREARRLAGELAGMAEERRRLLAGLVRALDDDRHRTVSELHSQTIGSLSTLGTIVQTACAFLPPATAATVKETLTQVQGDLGERAEELRRLLVAMRPPPLLADDPAGTSAPPPASDDVLATALRAYASDLGAGAAPGPAPTVRIDVDPLLELDRPTLTIVYRIAREALLNAARHARATSIEVTIGASRHPRGVEVSVTDDGIGFDTGCVREGSGLPAMQLFTTLGHGEMTVRSAPGRGTEVRSRLGAHSGRGGRAGTAPAGPAAPRPARRHLRLLPAPGAARPAPSPAR